MDNLAEVTRTSKDLQDIKTEPLSGDRVELTHVFAAELATRVPDLRHEIDRLPISPFPVDLFFSISSMLAGIKEELGSIGEEQLIPDLEALLKSLHERNPISNVLKANMGFILTQAISGVLLGFFLENSSILMLIFVLQH